MKFKDDLKRLKTELSGKEGELMKEVEAKKSAEQAAQSEKK